MNMTNQPAVRISQLDALRAVAIGIVLIHHYRDTRFFLSGFGSILFFVLSGYFATRTLLKLKQGIEAGRTNPAGAFRTFYLQRWLRLWPLYYLVLGLTLLLNVENARSAFFWNATFLSNFHVLLTQSWSGRFSPLWSLSVLEQFYMVWPALLFICPKKRLLPVVFGLIAIAPLYRIGCMLANASPYYWCVMPFASFDQLGCGALLALCQTGIPGRDVSARIIRLVGRVFAPAFALLLVSKAWNIDLPYSAIYTGTVASLGFVWLVNRAANGFSGRLGRLMQNPLLCHVGRMSYSIFLLHNFTALLVPKIGILKPVLDSNYRVVMLIPLTVLLAHVCWRLIESPILSFRRKLVPAPAAAPIPAGLAV